MATILQSFPRRVTRPDGRAARLSTPRPLVRSFTSKESTPEYIRSRRGGPAAEIFHPPQGEPAAGIFHPPQRGPAAEFFHSPQEEPAAEFFPFRGRVENRRFQRRGYKVGFYGPPGRCCSRRSCG